MSEENIVIIDYGSGNLRSAAKAFEHVIADQGLAFDVLVSDSAKDVEKAGHIVLPGQGAFGDCMAGLRSVDGMISALEDAVLNNKKPFLGICVGMQLLADKGYEGGETDGLGWIKGAVRSLKVEDESLKIPHMGWNELHLNKHGHGLFNGIKEKEHFYFVHSFEFVCHDEDDCLASFDYGGKHSAIVGKNNILGVQFHPEKSHDAGLALLRNFLNWQS